MPKHQKTAPYETRFFQDVIELLLLVAAIRAGRHRLAKGLLGEYDLCFDFDIFTLARVIICCCR